jgi:hypothetical protein
MSIAYKKQLFKICNWQRYRHGRSFPRFTFKFERTLNIRKVFKHQL